MIEPTHLICEFCAPCTCPCHSHPDMVHCMPCCSFCGECHQGQRKQFDSKESREARVRTERK